MLKPAQLYSAQLQEENAKIWYRLEYMYWNGGTGDCDINLPDNNYEKHCFVSVDGNDRVIGYIEYYVDWSAMSADRFGAISYDKGNIMFAKDLYQAICDIFDKYHMNRMQWCCFADNPAIRGYRNFIKKHGGVECGHYRQVAKLIDGKLHDMVVFEILAYEFDTNLACRRIKAAGEAIVAGIADALLTTSDHLLDADGNNMGDRIAHLLSEIGMTQKELADKIGVTEISIYRYINGERDPKGSIIVNLARELHTTTDYLLLGVKSQERILQEPRLIRRRRNRWID